MNESRSSFSFYFPLLSFFKNFILIRLLFLFPTSFSFFFLPFFLLSISFFLSFLLLLFSSYSLSSHVILSIYYLISSYLSVLSSHPIYLLPHLILPIYSLISSYLSIVSSHPIYCLISSYLLSHLILSICYLISSESYIIFCKSIRIHVSLLHFDLPRDLLRFFLHVLRDRPDIQLGCVQVIVVSRVDTKTLTI